MSLPVFRTEARSILSRTSGFIAQAGFTHSLTPARNCTFGCTYCYVPTLHIFGGLQRADWERWGQFTTFKTNAAELLEKQVRPDQVIYCSPLVDPYQPAEQSECLMPALLDVLLRHPPGCFVIQTRGPLILRDLRILKELARRTNLRVSFSVTTNQDEIRRLFEPHCPPNEERLDTVRQLVASGIRTHVTLAPLLPCDVESLAESALAASPYDLIGDPLHIRAVKRTGATTREAAWRIACTKGFESWFDPDFQAELTDRIRRIAQAHTRDFKTGPQGFSRLTNS